jgi:hypothetical protein
MLRYILIFHHYLPLITIHSSQNRKRSQRLRLSPPPMCVRVRSDFIHGTALPTALAADLCELFEIGEEISAENGGRAND